ncbi:MAG: DEAD/DEAH box helicase family protein [Sulfurimonadaceae bacterium]|jgi:hypothetical protein|nr:DEAD/DEAH box helicase family protein [Sulfurimonadaceae bacterium]
MNFSFLTSFFKPKQTHLQTPDSLLIKKIKNIADQYNLSLFHNKAIYHHNQKKIVPLIILHPNKGLFLFEHKDWSYDDLKNATIEKATNKNRLQNNLAFGSLHDFILLKYKELTHTDTLEFCNFLLMENLDSTQYEYLDDSFKELLPKHRIIFNDSSYEEIRLKFSLQEPLNQIYEPKSIFPNLFIQYALFDTHQNLSLATKEQRDFIDARLLNQQSLAAKTGSGKTNAILLKALVEKLENPQKQITIIEPTRIACDILRQKLLILIEHAIVTINPLSIEILTPLELINKQLTHSNKPLLHGELFIDKKLFSKSIKIADLVICDDSDLLSDEFIQYISLMQKKDTLLLVTNSFDPTPDFFLQDNFISENKQVIFKQANQHAKSMQLLRELSTKHAAKDILVVCDSLTKVHLQEDLESFIEDKAILLDSSKTLLNQELDALLLASYSEISGLHAKFVLMLDIDKASQSQIEYAKNLATDTLYIVYEESCEMIEKLKEQYESQTNEP